MWEPQHLTTLGLHGLLQEYLYFLLIWRLAVAHLMGLHCQMVRCLANGELERMWMEANVIEFEVLSWHFPGHTKKNQERLCLSKTVLSDTRKGAALEHQ
jgi:hypothetical protein